MQAIGLGEIVAGEVQAPRLARRLVGAAQAALIASCAALALLDAFSGIRSVPYRDLDALNTGSEYAAMVQIYRGDPRIWLALYPRGYEYLGNPARHVPTIEERADFNFAFTYLWAAADGLLNFLTGATEPVHAVWTGRLLLSLAELAVATALAWYLSRFTAIGAWLATLVALHFLLAPVPIHNGKILSNTPFASAALLAFAVFFATLYYQVIPARTESTAWERWKLPTATFLVSLAAMWTEYTLWAGLALVALYGGARALFRPTERAPLLRVVLAIHAGVAVGLITQAAHYRLAMGWSWLQYLQTEYARHEFVPLSKRIDEGIEYVRGHFRGWPYFSAPAFWFAFVSTSAIALSSGFRRMRFARSHSHWKPLLLVLAFYLVPTAIFVAQFSHLMGGGPERNTCLEIVYLAPYLLLAAVASSLGGWRRVAGHAAVGAALAWVILNRVFVCGFLSPPPAHVALLDFAGRVGEGYSTAPVESAERIRLVWNLAHGHADLEYRYPASLHRIEAGPAILQPLANAGDEYVRSLFQIVLGIWYPHRGGSRFLFPVDPKLDPKLGIEAVIVDSAARKGVYRVSRPGEAEFRIAVRGDEDSIRELPTIDVRAERRSPTALRRLLDPRRRVFWSYRLDGSRS